MDTLKPESETENLDKRCSAAAVALADADIILLVAGAGWSADSGLPVYNDIARVPAYERLGLTYSDISQPHMLHKDPSLFYGFWGQALKDYRNTVPHEGFGIVSGWREDKMQRGKGEIIAARMRDLVTQKLAEIGSREQETPAFYGGGRDDRHTPFEELSPEEMAGAFYCFTSNCDAHFYDFFPAADIHDCHGNVELWQCSGRDCESGIWRAPVDWDIAVDRETMMAPPFAEETVGQRYQDEAGTATEGGKTEEETPRLGQSRGIGVREQFLKHMPTGRELIDWRRFRDKDGKGNEESPNWPKCERCGALARPAIFMFSDFGWKYDRDQDDRWNAWREAVVELCRESEREVRVCVLEVGCGKRVVTCRTVSEGLVEDLIDTGFGDNARLVRINPDFPEADKERLGGYVISVQSRGLAALVRIQEIYSNLKNAE